jgi:hypothetical protein
MPITNSNDDIKTEEINAEDPKRTQIVAAAVASAIREANQQDWEAACRSILENKSLMESEKNFIVALIKNKQLSICTYRKLNSFK